MSLIERCDVPPEGWWCSREKGHDGPCAAREIEPMSWEEIATRLQAEKIAPHDQLAGAVAERDALAAYLRWLTDGARGEPPMMGVDVHAMLDRIQRGQYDETAEQLDRAVNEAARRLREEQGT